MSQLPRHARLVDLLDEADGVEAELELAHERDEHVPSVGADVRLQAVAADEREPNVVAARAGLGDGTQGVGWAFEGLEPADEDRTERRARHVWNPVLAGEALEVDLVRAHDGVGQPVTVETPGLGEHELCRCEQKVGPPQRGAFEQLECELARCPDTPELLGDDQARGVEVRDKRGLRSQCKVEWLGVVVLRLNHVEPDLGVEPAIRLGERRAPEPCGDIRHLGRNWCRGRCDPVHHEPVLEHDPADAGGVEGQDMDGETRPGERGRLHVRKARDPSEGSVGRELAADDADRADHEGFSAIAIQLFSCGL